MLKRVLQGVLEPQEISKLYGGFDVVGDIAIIKIPEDLLDLKGTIAKAIIENVKSVKTVLRQALPVSGEYRIRQLEFLLGVNRTTTIHREHGCIFKIDLSRAYFSPRLSTERLRVAKQVREGETVVNMFGGVGAFSVIIAKVQPRSKVYSVDLNPAAYELAIENAKLNKLFGHVVPILGDAREVIMDSLRGVADRVLMPLPERASEYLGSAILALKPGGGLVHYYSHICAPIRDEGLEGVKKEVAEKLQADHEFLSARVVREVGPRWLEVVLDIIVRPSKDHDEHILSV